MPRPIRIRRAVSRADLNRAFAIRVRVFVVEQGVPREIELDDDDAGAAHLLAWRRGRAVGTARIVLAGRRAKIGRMAVLKRQRGHGIGKELLAAAVKLARRKGAKRLFLHAQLPVVGFYRKMGFRPAGPVFVEAGIRHRKMVL